MKAQFFSHQGIPKSYLGAERMGRGKCQRGWRGESGGFRQVRGVEGREGEGEGDRERLKKTGWGGEGGEEEGRVGKGEGEGEGEG